MELVGRCDHSQILAWPKFLNNVTYRTSSKNTHVPRQSAISDERFSLFPDSVTSQKGHPSPISSYTTNPRLACSAVPRALPHPI